MNFSKKALTHLWPLLVGFVLVSIFFAPLYSGKSLLQSDNVQLGGTLSEVNEYHERGDMIGWNNREFAGVPLQTGSEYNPFKYLQHVLLYGFIPKAVMMIFLLFAGFYVLLQVFKVEKWLAAIGSFAYAFSTFNIISLEAGHDNKVLAIAFMAPVLAGVILAYRGEWLKSGIVTFLAAGFQLYYGHIQITYYLLIMVLAYLVVVIYETVKSKNWKSFFQGSAVLVVATLLAFGCNFGKMYAMVEYSSYSTRGGSELKKSEDAGTPQSGLDKEYALAWSNGQLETFTLMFPYFHGGATGEQLDENSETYKALSSRGVPQQTINSVVSNLPLYWGTQPFTAGPIYFGAIVCLFFILSLLVLDGPLRWWGVTVTMLSLLLAMGKNLEWFTDIFFYYVPLYNKFRSVTMILAVAQLAVPFLAVLAIDKILKGELDTTAATKKVLISMGVIGGVGVFFLLFRGGFFDFSAPNDSRYGFPDWLVQAMRSDRKALFSADIIRSIVLVALAGGAVWLYLKKILKLQYAMAGLALLVFFDLWVVNKRYLGSDDFITSRRSANIVSPSPANQQIMQDKDYYRVLNLSVSPFQDGTTSYFHYSIGGYSAIKFQRYQELYDQHISQMNEQVLNMLNTRYFILSSGENQPPQAQRNSAALGNAWAVRELAVVPDADAEIAYLETFNPAETAVIDQRFGLSKATYSGQAAVSLASYHPERMVYAYESSEPQFVVFSEIYYKPGWKAFIDGQETDHVRVNYVLRGMEIPAGKHEVVFEYAPLSKSWGNWSVILSVALGLVLAGLLYFRNRQVKQMA